VVGATVGKYKLVEKIGAGGMGDVFRAVDPTTNAVVAIKVLNAIAGADGHRFVTEARAVNRVPHDGVVKVIEVAYMDGGRPYLVMELLEGKSLEAAIVREERPALTLVDQLLSIVAAAHSVGIVHRDLKPGNIWLSRNGRVRVLDFGVAKLLDENMGVTRTGAMVGTPAYMSPEQVKGAQVDARADLYAIGVMTYELATGKRPYEAPSAFAIAQKHVQAPIPRLPAGAHPAAQPFLDRALAKEPKDRFASADEMRAALAGWLGRSSSPALSSSALAPAPRRGFGPRGWFALAAATIVSTGLIVAAAVSRRGTRPPPRPAPATVVAPRAPDIRAVAAGSGEPIANDELTARQHVDTLKARYTVALTKPLVGPSTPERVTHRAAFPYYAETFLQMTDDWAAADKQLNKLDEDLSLWGTAREPFASGTQTDLAPAAGRLDPALDSRNANRDDNPVVKRHLALRFYLAQLQVLPLVGRLTPQREQHRAQIADAIKDLVGDAPWDWARIDADITKMKAELDTWNTDQEVGWTPLAPDPLAPAIDGFHEDPNDATHGNSDKNPIYRRWVAMIAYARQQYATPMLGHVTAERTAHRDQTIAAMRAIGKTEDHWGAIDAKLTAFRTELETWGTAREMGYTRGVAAPATNESSTWISARDPRNTYRDNPALSDLEKEVYANQRRLSDVYQEALRRDFVGPFTQARIEYRWSVASRMATASQDPAAARQVLIDMDAEMATWGTPNEKYATGTEHFHNDAFGVGR
jgi:hypothetical protein